VVADQDFVFGDRDVKTGEELKVGSGDRQHLVGRSLCHDVGSGLVAVEDDGDGEGAGGGSGELPPELSDPQTVEELKAALEHLGIEYPTAAKKAELVELFEAAILAD